MAAETSRETLTLFRRYVWDACGITLGEDKDYLLESRLGQVVRKLELPDLDALYQATRNDADQEIKKIIVNAITTNETYFFREPTTFELLAHKIFPDLFDKKTDTPDDTVRIWCAACSSGQEAFSTAFTIHDLCDGDPPCDVQMIATDISDEMVTKASHAYYSQFEIGRGLDINKVNRYFDKVSSRWMVKDEIRGMIHFSRYNLFDAQPVRPYPFDVVLCRNVAIYFSDDDKKTLYASLARQIRPGGYLILSATEMLENHSNDFERVDKFHKSSFYIRK